MEFGPLHPIPEVSLSTIAPALRRLQGNLEAYLPAALPQRLAQQLGRPVRQRLLTPTVTMYLFAQQILHGNPACSHLRHIAGLEFTASAYCQARGRLPVDFFRQLQQEVTAQCRSLQPPLAAARWKGHRLFLCDGSRFSMPDTPELQAVFGQPPGQRPGCGFPVAHWLAGFDAQTGFLCRVVVAPWHTHDMAHAARLHEVLAKGDVFIGDRAFCSYAHLALCRQRRLHAVFRAHQRQIIDFRSGRRHTATEQAGVPRSRWLRRLGPHDQLVEYRKPKQRPGWLSAEAYAALPDTLRLRERRVRVTKPGRRVQMLTLVTTLTDPRSYSRRALAKLYGRRWQVEVNLRHLKQTLHLDVLRCTSILGVLKELEMILLIYNLVRRVMLEAAACQGVPPDRISFVDALRWLRHAQAGDVLPRLKVNPQRPGRAEPRVRKRRPKKYPLMNKPRTILRKNRYTKKKAA